jgi:hypothetical protein
MNVFKSIALSTIATVLLGSCANNQWHAEGNINGIDKTDLILEAPNGYGGWYPIDTITTDKKGNFKVAEQAAGHPEIFRLTLNGESIYFPIDSIETVSISANADNIAGSAVVSGTESADKLQEVNVLINKVVNEQGEQAIAYDETLKRSLAEVILRDPAGIVAYYTLFRRVGDTPLFNPSEKSDLRMIGAVANAFATQRPADPRTPFLKQLFISNRHANLNYAPTDTIIAEEITLPEISLLDKNGRTQSLTEVASKGNVVIVNFTAYTAQNSPALNIELAKVYQANHSKGLEIYQIAFDDDEFEWKQSAKNLPWITVYNSPKVGSENLVKYNVSALPTTFIVNRKGELVERVDNPTRIASAVARYL